MSTQTFETEIGGRKLIVEFSDLAMHANGSVTVHFGETVVFATATMSEEPRESVGYFPLTVDYEEKFYAAGAILGSRFMRREGRPSEEAVLVGRLIDRTLRPLFNKKIRNAIQVVVTTLSVDGENDPDIPAVIAASLALATSDIPWAGPVSAVRIGGNVSSFITNPTYKEREAGSMDVIVSGKDGKINMIEAGTNEVSEDRMAEAFTHALAEMKKIEAFQRDIIEKTGKEKKEVPLFGDVPEVSDMFRKHFMERLNDIVYIFDKPTRNFRIGELKKEWMSFVEEHNPDALNAADDIFEEFIDEIVHENIFKEDKRPDKRALDEVRELKAMVGVLPRTHGSGIFYRGETHILSLVTLGAPSDVQLIEGMEIKTKKRFMHHYNFPPFSTGEVGRMGSPGRREIGHGALAERALIPVIPPQNEFPYTIRIVSEAMSSNGSTSMASVCASTLAMMDAGIPIKKPVAGIAMGLMMKNEKEYKVLTDIQGPEDHHGDMDFKAAGTADGLTAIQMDVKVEGVTVDILKDAMAAAKKARTQILGVIAGAIKEPRAELSKHAPRIIILSINPEKIKDVIGPGGKVINKIIDQTGAAIDIEQDGSIFITSTTQEGGKKAEEMILLLTKEFQSGEEVVGKVTRIFEFGAMVEIAPGQEGLVHISELAPWHVRKVTDIVKPGDMIPVKVKDIDDQGRINLSHKAARPDMKQSDFPENNDPDDHKHYEQRKRRR
ncbi:MAG: polyribonucleotide nucleotidyltransferase [Candidatus Niyogibacteria bacterium CG10_big_fil_rev_8_21_14_0_10_46_36]|uniref:Polyribonucleotide nucleotidyltransferase n=1 Tax=Candidatus Niyogibacteria bacterium CG10_big_fil_rev_8_21_14_0_10_46_36 TaxID=1974726 RepID=A0A2H0TDF4_9BACT|nr:MAG: polyribonucleotide nucleotidyltransferase [Candidatus Niyogibacteria bacterium CG10_big_fil_rev_8_21_14_0_10_46_36]